MEVPDPPFTLPQLALEEWKRITPLLESLGLIAHIDRAALAGYCLAWQALIETEKALHERRERGESPYVNHSSTGKPDNVSAEYRAFNAAQAEMRKYISLFGLSPADRSRITVDGDSETSAKKKTQAINEYMR